MAPQNHSLSRNNNGAPTNGETRNHNTTSNNAGHPNPNQASHSQGRRSGHPAPSGSIMMNAHSSQQHQQQRHGSVGGTPSRQFASSAQAQPTPLFERLVTEEVQELKAYARIIENQSRRLAELEKIHGDLEVRLEVESRGKAQMEATLEQREREWAMKFQGLETDRDHWKSEFEKEQQKNAKLLDQIVRKEQDIHRMLQRKVRLRRWLKQPHSSIRCSSPFAQSLFCFSNSTTTLGNRRQSNRYEVVVCKAPASVKPRRHPESTRKAELLRNS